MVRWIWTPTVCGILDSHAGIYACDIMGAMPEDRVMDDDYAILSLLVGLFAGRVDAYLGKLHFEPLTRKESWNFTWQLLAEWQQQAIAMGVPVDVAMPTPEDLALSYNPKGLKSAKEAQRLRDLETGHSSPKD
jgi:hypothetical protein